MNRRRFREVLIAHDTFAYANVQSNFLEGCTKLFRIKNFRTKDRLARVFFLGLTRHSSLEDNYEYRIPGFSNSNKRSDLAEKNFAMYRR